MMLNKFRKSTTLKGLAVFSAINLLGQIIFPTAAFALGGGPSQSEFQSFEPVGTSEMVNLSSGDFTYNIPLLDVDGYPINLSYHSGVSMDQEASWTGLGWNVNPGVISRGMRGLPDDFAGDLVEKKINLKKNETYGIKANVGVELFGTGFTPSMGMGVFYNNYKGVGFEFSAGIGFEGPLAFPLTANLGVTANSQEGMDIGADIGLSVTVAKGENNSTSIGLNVGSSYSSRGGVKSINVGSSIGFSNKGGNSKSYDIGGGSIPIGTQSYVPKISVPTDGFGLSFAFSGGGEVFGLDVFGGLTGWYSSSSIATNSLQNPAYGYLYAHEGASKIDALQDFNREKDGVFHTTMPNLPITNHTYDIYSVSGQGIGGMYRPYRSEVGTVSDPFMISSSTDNSFSGEIGAGNLFHAGANYNHTSAYNISGAWNAGNESSANLQYKDLGGLYEPAYFKRAGELTTRDNSYYTKVGGSSPLRLDMEQEETSINGFATLSGVPTANQHRTERVQRNQNLSYLTALEASNIGLSTIIENEGSQGDLPRRSDLRGDKHLSEVSVLREDGARYVYGIPAYNVFQKDVTFNATGNTPDCNTGLVDYSGTDNTIANDNGMDNYFEATRTPGYAHSYLLTAIISPDYVDITGNGPTADDLGNYTKFNYAKNAAAYNWRVPLEANKAIYNGGFRSDTEDDKGSYIWGQKEIWYLHSVETKNYVANFNLSERKDGIGVNGENGGVSSSNGQKLSKLDNITLYAKEDIVTPIKVVHFEYDYSLCPSVPNNDGTNAGINLYDYDNNGSLDDINTNKGKLTLKKVYFTYGNSEKGQLNPYVFHYADSDHNMGAPEAALNPPYNIKGYDRWGNYKLQPTGVSCGNQPPGANPLSNGEFPYTEQSANTDNYSAAWSLSTIELPSGGILKVDYESDDYAYVQDKRAQQMMMVVGTTEDMLPTSTVYSSLDKKYLKVQIPSGANIGDLLGSENGTQIYFKFLVNILGNYDYVPGYAKVNSATVANGFAYIELQDEHMKDNSSGDAISPISKASFQMVRNDLSRVLYPANASTGFSMSTFTNILSNYITDAKTLVKGINKTLYDKGIGHTFIANKSWVRLQNPDGNKKGGGVRVKQITMSDEWSSMVASEDASEYGQMYNYSLNGTMSSGVASYEPLVGGDENPFRKPMPYSVERSFYNNDVMFQEEPYGESLFPSANVVYSKITVKNIDHTDVNRNATGRTEYEFYTAKDFPIIRKQTGMDKKVVKPGFLNQMFSKKHTYRFAASQGYSIELNDMHGKPKAKKSFAEGGLAAIEGIEYNYKHSGNRLVNNVDVINNRNTITNKVIGEEIDVVMDSRRQLSSTETTSYMGGIDMFMIGVFPVPIPHLWVANATTLREFKSSVSTKVIQKYGVLDEVVVYDQNSKVTTQNKLYDEATGKVLLTKTINEFDDNLYALNYPAHWGYEGMEQASKNIDARISLSTNSSGKVTSSLTNLTPGDELIKVGTSVKIWITSSEATGNLYAIDNGGATVNNLTNDACKIVRSGKRNLHSMSMGNIVSRKNPVVGNGIAPDVVLNANAIEYSDQWGTKVFNEGVYSSDCGEQPIYTLDCSDNSTDNDLLTFLNEMSQLNGTTPFLVQDNYNLDVTPVTPGNPLFNNTDYEDLTVCEANLTSTGALHKLKLNIIDETSINIILASNLYLSVGYHANFAGGCFYQTALLLNLSGTFPGSLDMTDIVGFNNIIVTGYESFTVEADLGGPVVTLYGSVESHINNVSLQDCESSLSSSCLEALELEAIINPYTKGVRGNYRANKAYAYNAVRDQSNSDIREDGEISTVPFWGYNSAGNEWLNIFNVNHPLYSPTNGESWVLNSEVTKYNPSGNQLESRDALGRYSAAQYGYNNTMAVAEVFNSKYINFGFDGFEDYQYYSPGCEQDHLGWNFCLINNEDAHTGRYSLRLTATDARPVLQVPIDLESCQSSSPHSVPYAVSCEDNNGVFTPEAGGKYIFSCWIKEKNTPPDVLIYNNASIAIQGNNSNITINDIKYSRIIDGWQKIEYTFEVSDASVAGDNLQISLNNSGTETAYFDDMRVQPFNSTMNSYVYDPISLRLWAELDDRNFATFYEYDEEGTLVRVKKETSKGIKTIQENRAGVKK